MNKLIILKYMDKLTQDDILKFSYNQNVTITDNELNIIYTYIKKYPERILNEPLEVLSEIKDDISTNVYNKLLELYYKYKNKIS